ncbi:BofC C-terminal domain-containing protein [Schnuerera sp.]|uniref:BofC C-terminal domain-containing protein n=1 Tax=Schnuerera sp. TaxID=2794844 RepID=UPI002C3AA309|nr:BofC C-terminal domain-containing protein [Schnuerera sp.]HSH36430.1 BofC C-terminal domain-containing protein [Schnuerera sp.]
MKKQNAILIFLFCATLFFISFIYGYKMMGPKINKDPLIIEDDIIDDDLEILKEEERISPNVFIEKKTYYKECNHNITKLNELDEKIVNMTEKQYREYMKDNFPNIKIISFSTNRIVLREEKEHLCPNHYIIGESEGKIAIYGIDERGEKVLRRIFKDYPITLLKEIDQNKLKDGIRVDSEEELSDVLENFIS